MTESGKATPLRQHMIEDIVRVPRILARKKLIYAVSPNVDPSINRAMVADCAISATHNYLKLHMPKTLIPLFGNLHAKTQKLWKHSTMRLAGFRSQAVSSNCPLMHSASPRRCPPYSTRRLPRAGATPCIEGHANTQSS
jgi:hypothetical protein